MQQGFAMLEVGSCAKDHTKEILLKNIMDAIAIGRGELVDHGPRHRERRRQL